MYLICTQVLQCTQGQVKDLQRELEEAFRVRDEVQVQSKENEKKQRALEAELAQLTEELQTALKMRKQAETERDEMLEEQNSSSGTK